MNTFHRAMNTIPDGGKSMEGWSRDDRRRLGTGRALSVDGRTCQAVPVTPAVSISYE